MEKAAKEVVSALEAKKKELEKEKGATEQLKEKSQGEQNAAEANKKLAVASRDEFEKSQKEVLKKKEQWAVEERDRCWKHMYAEAARGSQLSAKMIKNFGTDDADALKKLAKRMNAMMNTKDNISLTMQVKRERLKQATWFLDETIKSLESPAANPLAMELSDKVDLIEHTLDESFKLNLVEGGGQVNFEKILNHVFSQYQTIDNPDKLPGYQRVMYDAVDAVRNANLTVKHFIPRANVADLSLKEQLELKEQMFKAAKKGQTFSVEEFIEKQPIVVRIWEEVKPHCKRKAESKFGELVEKVSELTLLEEEVGNEDDREEMRERYDEETRQESESLASEIFELQQALEECDRSESPDEWAGLRKEWNEKKKEKREHDQGRPKQWREKVNKLKGLHRTLKAGVGSSRATLDDYKKYVKDVETSAQNVIDQLSFTILGPFRAFSQKFSKAAVKRCLQNGQQGFYMEAQKFNYASDQFVAIRSDDKARSAFLENSPPRLELKDRTLLDAVQVD